MNFKACVFAAALLLTGNFVSANQTVELVKVEAPVVQNQNQKIDAAILTLIVEVHATQLYTLSVEQSWEAYYNGDLVITELDPGIEYKLVHDGVVEILILDTL